MRDTKVIKANHEFELKRRHDRIKFDFENGIYVKQYMQMYKICYATATKHLMRMVDMHLATRRNIYSLNGIRSKVLYRMK